MVNSVYDPRVEPHQSVLVVGEGGKFLGRMQAIENMVTTTGNRIESICEAGIKISEAGTGDSYFVKEAEISLAVAHEFGFRREPAEVADELIKGIRECPHLNALWRFERRRRDLWRRLNQFPCAVQPPGHSNNSFTEYFRVMAAFADHKRNLETGRATTSERNGE